LAHRQKKIEEERSSFWKEYSMVRRESASLSMGVGRPYEPLATVPAVPSVPKVPTVSHPSIQVVRSPGFPSEGQVMRTSLKASVLQKNPSGGDSGRQAPSSHMSTAVSQGPVTTSTSPAYAQPPMVFSKLTGGSATMSTRPQPSLITRGVANVTPVVRPLSYDRVSNIRSYQPPPHA